MNRVITNHGGDEVELPEPVVQALEALETSGIGYPRSYFWDMGFESLKPEKYQKKRHVYTHKETENLVYKVAPRDGHWESDLEISVWFDENHPSFSDEVPQEIKQYLAPIIDSDIDSGENRWLIMPRAEQGTITREEAIEAIRGMVEHGWVVTDHFPDNMGKIDGEVVFVDYGQLKPVRYLDDDWEEKMHENPMWD